MLPFQDCSGDMQVLVSMFSKVVSRPTGHGLTVGRADSFISIFPINFISFWLPVGTKQHPGPQPNLLFFLSFIYPSDHSPLSWPSRAWISTWKLLLFSYPDTPVTDAQIVPHPHPYLSKPMVTTLVHYLLGIAFHLSCVPSFLLSTLSSIPFFTLQPNDLLRL